MIYVNDSGSPNLSLEKIQKLYYMKILNDTHVEVVINCGTNFVEGNYTVKYNGVSLLEEPHPSRFTVKFAGNYKSLKKYEVLIKLKGEGGGGHVIFRITPSLYSMYIRLLFR